MLSIIQYVDILLSVFVEWSMLFVFFRTIRFTIDRQSLTLIDQLNLRRHHLPTPP